MVVGGLYDIRPTKERKRVVLPTLARTGRRLSIAERLPASLFMGGGYSGPGRWADAAASAREKRIGPSRRFEAAGDWKRVAGPQTPPPPGTTSDGSHGSTEAGFLLMYQGLSRARRGYVPRSRVSSRAGGRRASRGPGQQIRPTADVLNIGAIRPHRRMPALGGRASARWFRPRRHGPAFREGEGRGCAGGGHAARSRARKGKSIPPLSCSKRIGRMT